MTPLPVIAKSSQAPILWRSSRSLTSKLWNTKGMHIQMQYVFFFITIYTLGLILPPQPFALPRAYKDNDGRKKQPGLKTCRNGCTTPSATNLFRHIMEDVCLGPKPWSNPALPSLNMSSTVHTQLIVLGFTVITQLLCP